MAADNLCKETQKNALKTPAANYLFVETHNASQPSELIIKGMSCNEEYYFEGRLR